MLFQLAYMINWVGYIFSWLDYESVNLFLFKVKAGKIEKVFNLKFISSSGTIRGKFIFNKCNKRCNIFFKEKHITRYFVRYMGRTSSGKNNTIHNVRGSLQNNNATTSYNRTKINRLKTHIQYEIFILWYILGKTFQSGLYLKFILIGYFFIFLFFIFISIFILLTRRKATEALYVG